MQLPPDEELVMVSGVRPIRAKKLRYYQDRNFTERIEAAATVSNPPVTRGDDWRGRTGVQRVDGVGDGAKAESPPEEGGHEQKLNFDPPPRGIDSAEPEPQADIAPEADEFGETARSGLKPAQRALGLDQADKDLMPDF